MSGVISPLPHMPSLHAELRLTVFTAASECAELRERSSGDALNITHGSF